MTSAAWEESHRWESPASQEQQLPDASSFTVPSPVEEAPHPRTVQSARAWRLCNPPTQARGDPFYADVLLDPRNVTHGVKWTHVGRISVGSDDTRGDELWRKVGR